MKTKKKTHVTRLILVEISDNPYHRGHAIHPNGEYGGVIISHSSSTKGLFNAMKKCGVKTLLREEMPNE